MKDHNYQVSPIEIEPSAIEFNVADWRKRDNLLVNMYVGSGCLVMMALFFVLGALIRIFLAEPSAQANATTSIAILLALVFSIGGVLLVGRRLDRVRIFSVETKLNAEADEKAGTLSQEEAKRITSKVLSIYESSSTLAAELTADLREASLWLEDAEGEYKEKAFSSFWDSIEDAARYLADYRAKLGKISKNAHEYYQTLSVRQHNFPTFPVTNGTIPDASFVTGEFSRIVRLGQTNFEFASIWEHRRTREVLIAGFRSLGDAVSNLSFAIEGSVSQFQESISSSAAKFVEEGIRTREVIVDTGRQLDTRLSEQSTMLDNIQRGRKPH